MKYKSVWVALMVISLLLASCSTPTPEIVEKIVTEIVKETVIVEGTPQVIEKEITKVVEVEKVVTATPEPKMAPAVGGTLVYGLAEEPDTLDVHKSGRLFIPCQFFGAGLIARHPNTGELVPYLAESWTVGPGGMSYEFKLREDVTFHDGTPLTAQDYAYTFNRAIDPETKSPTAGQTLVGLAGAEAVDDRTLVLTMGMPNSVLLDSMANTCYLQPIPQAAVEEMGDDFGRNPIGVGPFKFKEWVTGEKIVLERNPDFAWGPGFTQGGAPMIETLEFRIIPEYATRLAGLESGELDFINLQAKDVERITGSGLWQMLSVGRSGAGVRLEMNTSRAPFDDLRVRQAFSYAVNRPVLVQVVESGQAVPSYGPITPATVGYWPGVEYLGYPYDLAKARALMAEAGYTEGSDGMLEKDGQPLTVGLTVDPSMVKVGEILKEQFEQLGVQVELQQLEPGVFYETTSVNGDFDLAVTVLGWPNYGIMFVMFHSSNIGGWNISRVNTLDNAVIAMVIANGAEAIEKAVTELQRLAVENAYGSGLYGPLENYALSKKVQGAVYVPAQGWLYLWDAYIEMMPE
ncbi:MAG: ABC transporter substrate-binding protein [Chloroflexota bacterium]